MKEIGSLRVFERHTYADIQAFAPAQLIAELVNPEDFFTGIIASFMKHAEGLEKKEEGGPVSEELRNCRSTIQMLAARRGETCPPPPVVTLL